MGAHQSRPVQIIEDYSSSKFKTLGIVNPTTSSQDCVNDAQTPLTGSLSGEVECDDDWIILTKDQFQRVVQFRKDINLCKTDQERYEVCLQVRDEQLAEYNGVHLLAASLENVMFSKCIEYKNKKERIGNPLAKVSGSEDDDTIYWGKFFDIAKRGRDRKSECVTALKTVARYWGQDIVQHYQWACKGRGYCDKLRSAAVEVHDWKTAVTRINLSMITRSQYGMTLKRRPIQASVNPIEPKDLENVRKRLEDEEKIISIPAGFGFDKFGLLVHKEYAEMLSPIPPRPDESFAAATLALETSLPVSKHAIENSPKSAILKSMTKTGVSNDCFLNASIDHSLPPELEDGTNVSYSQPHIDSSNTAHATTECSGIRVLRQRLQKPSYRETRCIPKYKIGKPVSSTTSISCCPPQVQSELSASSYNPSLFTESVAFPPYIEKLGNTNHRESAERVSAIKLGSLLVNKERNTSSSRTDIKTPGVIPARRRAASLPDLGQQIYIPKRQKSAGLFSYPDVHMEKSEVTGQAPMHDMVADDTYRRQVLVNLEEKIQGATNITTHGLETDKLILDLLQRAEAPNTDEKRGAVEALFMTETRAATHVETDTSDLPIFTENQQPFQWSGRGRPIAELFNRMEYLDYTASVQIPSCNSTSASFVNRPLSQITSRFLANEDTDDPWDIPHMRNPLPSTLPRFLHGENCQLLLRIRDVISDTEGAEKVVVSKKQRIEWRDVPEWVLLSEGGYNTAPYKDFLPAWITAQEEPIGFGWMSLPTRQEEEDWEADPHHYVGGRWRYVILKPGQTVFFMPATIRFMFRLRGKQTLGLGGHILQWSGLERWLQSVMLQTKHPWITNEDIRNRTLQYVKAVETLVAAKINSGRAHELGGEDAVKRIFILMKEIGHHNIDLGRRHPLPY